MAELAPLPAVRFRTADLTDVIAPPFDVVSAEQQAALYERSPHNVIRIELGREADRYAEAARCYTAWRSEGVLQQDEPSFYLYEQRFTAPGQTAARTRRAIIARIRLEPWSAGVVLPHELTHTQAKVDRLQLMQATKANISPIFSLYEDPAGDVARLLAPVWTEPPTASGTDIAGEQHRLWVVAAERLSALPAAFATRTLYIADGHHRYETGLAYRDERRASGSAAADFVMMTLVDFADPGLVVLPTHRLFHSLSFAQERRLDEDLGTYFEVIAAADGASPRALAAALEQAATSAAPAFVLYGPLPSGLRVLALKTEWRGRTFDESHSAAWNTLDVSIVHAVFERILGMTAEDAASQRYVRYIQEPPDAIHEVQRGGAQIAVLLRPTPATAIRDVAEAGDTMPQKSTYFYPKMGTGVVLNPLD